MYIHAYKHTYIKASYAGKKILQIKDKTMMDFFSLASGIYHCFFFLNLPLVMSDGVLVWP